MVMTRYHIGGEILTVVYCGNPLFSSGRIAQKDFLFPGRMGQEDEDCVHKVRVPLVRIASLLCEIMPNLGNLGNKLCQCDLMPCIVEYGFKSFTEYQR
jgi:hypothetical protein